MPGAGYLQRQVADETRGGVSTAGDGREHPPIVPFEHYLR